MMDDVCNLWFPNTPTLYLLYLTRTIEAHPKITENIVASINWHLAWNL